MPAKTTKTTTKAPEEKPAPRRPVRQADLTQFARENESIHVQNTASTITVFTARVEGADEVSEFAASGDPSGNDVMELPSTYLKLARFREALRKGILKIVDGDDPAVVDAYENQQNAYEAQQQTKAESERLIAAQPIRAFSGVQCLAQDGRNQCAEFAVYAQNTRERPPLCQKHAHLASQFTPEETGTFTDGQADVRWNQVALIGR